MTRIASGSVPFKKATRLPDSKSTFFELVRLEATSEADRAKIKSLDKLLANLGTSAAGDANELHGQLTPMLALTEVLGHFRPGKKDSELSQLYHQCYLEKALILFIAGRPDEAIEASSEAGRYSPESPTGDDRRATQELLLAIAKLQRSVSCANARQRAYEVVVMARVAESRDSFRFDLSRPARE